MDKTKITSQSMQRTEASLDGQNLAVSETYQSFIKALDRNKTVIKNLEIFEASNDILEKQIELKNQNYIRIERYLKDYEKLCFEKNLMFGTYMMQLNQLKTIVVNSSVSNF